MRYSYSSISTAKTCLYKWYWEYVKRERIPSGKAAQVGSSMHAILETYYKTIPGNSHDKNHLLELAKEMTVGAGHSHREEVISTLKKFDLTLLPEPMFRKYIATELQIKLNENYEVDENADFFIGIIDLLYYDPTTKKLWVIDYKSNKRPNADTQQLKLYSYLAYKAFKGKLDIKSITTKYVYLRLNQTIEDTPNLETLEEDLETYLKENINHLNFLVEKIPEEPTPEQIAEVFKPTPSWLCSWCGARAACPLYQHGMHVARTIIKKENTEYSIEEMAAFLIMQKTIAKDIEQALADKLSAQNLFEYKFNGKELIVEYEYDLDFESFEDIIVKNHPDKISWIENPPSYNELRRVLTFEEFESCVISKPKGVKVR